MLLWVVTQMPRNAQLNVEMPVGEEPEDQIHLNPQLNPEMPVEPEDPINPEILSRPDVAVANPNHNHGTPLHCINSLDS